MFVHDLTGKETERISVATGGGQGNERSFGPAISRTGQFVAYDSAADDLVPGDTNGLEDLFLRDRRTGEVRIVSVSTDERPTTDAVGGGYLSRDGEHIAFWSDDSRLLPGDTNKRSDIFTRDAAADLR